MSQEKCSSPPRQTDAGRVDIGADHYRQKTMTSRRFTLLGTLACAFAVDCSDSTTEAVKPPVLTITAVSAITQQGTVDQFVASKPTVRVTDATGQPVVGASVAFSMGGLALPTIATGSDGTASMAWRLSQTAGTQTMVAGLRSVAFGTLGATTTFTAVALADTLAAIEATSVAALVGIPSHDVATPPTVVAVDAYMNSKPGVEVTFEVAGGIGAVTPAKVTTDSMGQATVGAWTLGAGFTTDTLIARVPNLPPVYFTARVSPPFVVSSLVSGLQHACAISNGDVYCWGGNARGQVTPTNAVSPWTTPQLLALGPKAVSLSSGYNHTCAISNEVPPQAYCWGDNSSGQLGVASPGPGSVRVPVADGLAVVTTGFDHSCGLTPAGVAYCWGNGGQGQLGNGGVLPCIDDGVPADCPRPGPQPVSGNLRFVSITAGSQHTCGLVANGQMYCWGLDNAGQLGFSSGSPCTELDGLSYPYGSVYSPVACALTPQMVPGAPAFTAVAAGSGYTCASTTDGSVSCFGQYGGTQLVSNAPAFASLTPDGSCGVGPDGSAFCWIPGFDVRQASFSRAQPVVAGTAFSAITPAPNGFRCGILKSNGIAVCWGNNDSGQLGNGAAGGSAVPLPVASPLPPAP